MLQRHSAEQFLAELDDIRRRFHAASALAEPQNVALAEAVQRLRKLGFTTGEALKLLRSKA